ncbi:MAG TPA: hypothetical protein VFV43_13405, partial [Limnobacter sp.]|nr:hypothetical protein [Limnobacter sp.]
LAVQSGFLFTESLAKPLQASFCAASRAAEKRDYAHLFPTCQTLLAKNFYFFTTPKIVFAIFHTFS